MSWNAPNTFPRYIHIPGDSEIGTVFKIFRLLGTPTDATWPGHEHLPHWSSLFPVWPNTNLQPVMDVRPEFGEVGNDLLAGLLALSPPARLLDMIERIKI